MYSFEILKNGLVGRTRRRKRGVILKKSDCIREREKLWNDNQFEAYVIF